MVRTSTSVTSTSILPLSTRLRCSDLPHQPLMAVQRRLKSKRSSAQYIDPNAADADDVPVIKTKGKASKNNRAAQPTSRGARTKRGDAEQSSDVEYKTSTRNQHLPDEAFDFDAISSHMSRAVERFRSTASTLVGSFGRADPSLLDSIKVEYPAGSSSKALHPLRDFATVGVRDGALIVTAFDADMVKHIERAIYASNLNLTPQTQAGGEENVLRVAVPQPTTESRQALVKDLTKICENARVSIRDARHKAQKQIKSDIDRKVVGKSEGDRESKKVEAETKKWSTQVDHLFEKIKATLLLV